MPSLRQALRRLLSTPSTTLAVVVLLGLSVGAVTALYAAVDAFAFRPLPGVAASWELVRLSQKNVEKGWSPMPVSEPNFEDWRRLSESLEGVVAYRPHSVNVAGVGTPERVSGARVSASFFDLIGARPALGRAFEESDCDCGDEPMAVISHALWTRVFAQDRAALGDRLRLDGADHVVIGVMPEEFNFPPVPKGARADLWTLYAHSPAADRGVGSLSGVFARLRDGVSIEQARSELEALAERLAAAYPETNTNVGIEIEPARAYWGNPLRKMGLPVIGASILVLLLAAANVAGLLMMRQRVRRSELAVRTALGATRLQLLRQVLLECSALGIVVASAALLASGALIEIVSALIPSGAPLAGQVQLDMRTATVAIAATFAVMIMIALLSSLEWSLGSGTQALTGRGGARARWSGLRRSLLVAETAIALVAAVGTGLFVRSLAATLEEDPGFDAEVVLSAWTRLPSADYQKPEEIRGFYSRLLEGLESAPDIESAALANSIPLAGFSDLERLSIVGSEDAVAERPAIDVRRVTPGYFRTLGVSLYSGRLLNDGDGQGETLVNQAFVERYFAGGEALGRTITLHGSMEDTGQGSRTDVTVVGVVGNEKFWRMDLSADEIAQIYVPDSTNPSSVRAIALRAAGSSPEALAGTLRTVIAKLDPQAVIYRVSTLAERMARNNETRRATTAAMTLFGVLALGLAAAGLYAVIAQSVVERRPEIGVRMALGAQVRDVVSMVLQEGLKLVGVGLVIGLAGALLAGRALRSTLYGIESTDAASLLAASVALLGAALVATLWPAHRAARTDPLEALRQE